MEEAVAVAVGMLVLVGVEVAVAVGVRVGVGVGVRVAVGVGVLVGVAVGPSTVKVPLVRPVVTPPPLGLVAAALLSVSEEAPLGAPGNTSKLTVASVPSGIGVTLKPKMIIRTVPTEGWEQPTDLDTGALATAGSRVTARPLQDPLAAAIRLVSKLRSKLRPVTWAPSSEARLIGMLMPVSPGFPDPLPALIAAVGVCAAAFTTLPSTRTEAIKLEAALDIMELVGKFPLMGPKGCILA